MAYFFVQADWAISTILPGPKYFKGFDHYGDYRLLQDSPYVGTTAPTLVGLYVSGSTPGVYTASNKSWAAQESVGHTWSSGSDAKFTFYGKFARTEPTAAGATLQVLWYQSGSSIPIAESTKQRLFYDTWQAYSGSTQQFVCDPGQYYFIEFKLEVTIQQPL